MSTLRFSTRSSRSARPRHALAPILFLACAALIASACGSRGPLDINVVDWDAGNSGTLDGSVDLDGALQGDGAASGDGAIKGDARADSGLPPIVNCGACIAQNCGQQIFACLADVACRATFQCVVTKCLNGGGAGGPDPQCLFTCSGSDPQGAVQVLRVFTCIINKCGADCQAVLGGGGGTGGGRDAGRMQRPAACEAFTQWPEVCAQTSVVNGAGE